MLFASRAEPSRGDRWTERGGGRAVTESDTWLRQRRRAISGLGDALRILVERAAATEVEDVTLDRAAEHIRQASALLSERARDRSTLPAADDLLGGVRMYNP